MGGRIYIENLLRAVRTLAPGRLRTLLVCSKPSVKDNSDLAKLADGVLPVNEMKPRGYNTLRALVQSISNVDLDVLRLRRQYVSAGIDVLFPFNRPMPFERPHRLAWIPDFQHKHLPELFSKKELELRDHDFASIAKHAARIVVSSEAAARDLARFYPEAAEKARVMRFATMPTDDWFKGDASEICARYSLPEKFFIVCNQFWKHKNHSLLFESLERLREEGIAVKVVCTGSTKDSRQENMRYFEELTGFLRSRQLTQEVFILGLVPRADQIALLRSAVAVVQPSLFEGWSTVLEDARVFGKKVIASDLDVHREQDLTGARYFDPHDAGALAALMREIWVEKTESSLPADTLRNKSQERGRQFGERFLQIATEAAGGSPQ
jgi:glycosyltransferase involved in cell wall biosynthesis